MIRQLRRLRARFKYRHFERDLAQEIESHRAMAQERLEAGGVTTQQARHEAARALGNSTLAREDSRAMWIPLFAQQLAQDARYALRTMRRQPGFSIAAILMLTLGIGLVAGGYTVFNGLFIRGWALPDGDRVFRARGARIADPGAGYIRDGFSLGAYKHLRAHARAADYVALQIEYFRLRTDGPAQSGGVHTGGFCASDNLIETLRIPLQLGTGFAGMPSSETRALISHGVWQRVFAADPGIVGRTVWVSGVPASIVGVTAAGFDGLGPRALDIVVDLGMASRFGRNCGAPEIVKDETACCILLAGRMRDGWSRDQVREELDLLTAQYRQSVRQPALAVALMGTTPGEDISGAGQASVVQVVLGLIGAGLVLVMLLTCANVGNLYLARSLRREREIAIRLSLGASRARVIRQLLTEGLVMASIAGMGAFFATAGVPVLLRLVEDSASATMFASDWRVAVITAMAVVATCLLVSLTPALQTTRIAWRGANTTQTARTGRTRGIVLAAQIAIAAVLVLSATLIARGIDHAISAPADFALHTTTAVTLSAPAGLAYDSRKRIAIQERIVRAIDASGMRVGLAENSPASSRAGLQTSVRPIPSEVHFRTKLLPFSRSAFDILNVTLAAGRWSSDDPAAAEAVINETLARQIAPGESAVGKAVQLSFNDRAYTITGITRDAHLTTLSETEPMIHTPIRSSGMLPVLLVRTEPAADQKIRALVASVDPALEATLTPLSHSVKQTLENAMVGAVIASSLGLVALLLAVIGVFGVFSYLIEERRREIGIRLALGASRRQIGTALLHACRVPVTGGLIAGLALSVLAGIALQRFLFGLSPIDPVSYIATALVLGLAALVATAIPVRRALRVNPAVTLKAE